MAAGDPSITVRVTADLTGLQAGAKQAEAVVARTSAKLDQQGKVAGSKYATSLGRAMIGGLGAIALDRALEDALAKFDAGARGYDLGVAIAESLVAGLRSVPVAGPVGDAISRLLDPLFGSPLEAASDQEAAKAKNEALRAGQNRAADILDALNSERLTPRQRLQERLERQRQQALEALQGQPGAQRQILPLIDQTIRKILESFDKAEAERNAARTSAPQFVGPNGPITASFGTQFGEARFATGTNPLFKALKDTSESSKQTAANTKKTADAVAKMASGLVLFA